MLIVFVNTCRQQKNQTINNHNHYNQDRRRTVSVPPLLAGEQFLRKYIKMYTQGSSRIEHRFRNLSNHSGGQK